MQTVSLSLFRFDSLPARLWVLAQMAAARLDLARMTDGPGFWKLVGSGTGEGFTPRPNTAVWGILATWPDADAATAAVGGAPVWRRWRAHATESWSLFLTPVAARGLWSGRQPFAPEPRDAAPRAGACPAAATASGALPPGPLAALTRATLRARALPRFWGRVPDISARIGADPNVAFKIGLGEVPWIHQITFSVWPDAASMAAFARGDGPHGRAIRAVRDEGWFREELYARFRVAGETGTWGGKSPLARLKETQ
jgi:spheroidene monooxygenase